MPGCIAPENMQKTVKNEIQQAYMTDGKAKENKGKPGTPDKTRVPGFCASTGGCFWTETQKWRIYCACGSDGCKFGCIF